MKFHKLLSLLTLTATLVSCGKTSSGGDSKGWTITTLAKEPVRLEKQDNDCVGSFSLGDQIEFSIPQYIAGVSTTREIDFTGQVYKNYVESFVKKPITETTYGSEIEISGTVVYANGYREGHDYTEKYISKEKTLDVCPSSVSYKSFTYESSGLNISNSITKTFKKVAKIIGENALGPIKVNVAPIVKLDIKFVGGPKDRTGQQGYEADNAYYSPYDQAITFLPQSKRYQEKRGKIPFWQMPMVGSHEYGHHIFNSLISSKIKSKVTFSKRCFEHHTEINHASASGSKRDNTSKFALRSINEGFADLIAYYSLDNDERKMTGIKCFQVNRDIEYSHFGDLTSKLFTVNAVNSISSRDAIKPLRSCNTPDFQEVHDVGAMFAHSMNKLISKVTADKEVKLQILLNWAKSMAKEHKNISELAAGDYIFAAIELGYQTALNEVTRRAATEKDCEVMDSIFPDREEQGCRYLK